jgi:hypothetical protein
MLRIKPRLAFINGVLLENRVLIFRFQLLAVYVLLVHNYGECRIAFVFLLCHYYFLLNDSFSFCSLQRAAEGCWGGERNQCYQFLPTFDQKLAQLGSNYQTKHHAGTMTVSKEVVEDDTKLLLAALKRNFMLLNR